MGAPPKEATRPPKNKAPQASKEPGSVATPQSPDSGLCLAILLDRRCKHGERCDHHQVTLEDIFEARKQRGDLRGTPSEHASPRELAQNTRLYILQDLHKTKLCKPFQLGECPRGDECAFVHIRGPDAKQVNARANASKICPFEYHLGFCVQRICFFKHLKRTSSLAAKFGSDTANKNKKENRDDRKKAAPKTTTAPKDNLINFDGEISE